MRFVFGIFVILCFYSCKNDRATESAKKFVVARSDNPDYVILEKHRKYVEHCCKDKLKIDSVLIYLGKAGHFTLSPMYDTTMADLQYVRLPRRNSIDTSIYFVAYDTITRIIDHSSIMCR